MANLVVSDVCNQACPYCFAEDYFHSKEGKESHFITLDEFEKRLDFLERSGIGEARLIGGEPSLHPKLPELICRARARGERILLFTNGFLLDNVLACLETLSPEECTVLINMNTTGKPGTRRNSRVLREKVLHRLGTCALLGFNIYQTNFDLTPLLPVIENAGCRKAIRLGLAQPTLSGQTQFLNVKQYAIVGKKIAQFATKAAEAGVRLEFDCGFVRCMFSDDEIVVLHKAGADLSWRCNPILDIDLDQTVFHCFPLAGRIQTTLTDAHTAVDLRSQLSAQVEPYRLAGIYKTCSSCQFKLKEECTGGCLANTMRRFQRAQFTLKVPLPADWAQKREVQ